MKMQNKTKENDVNTLVKFDMPWPCLNILPNCDHTKIMCPNCAHQTGMLYSWFEASTVFLANWTWASSNSWR